MEAAAPRAGDHTLSCLHTRAGWATVSSAARAQPAHSWWGTLFFFFFSFPPSTKKNKKKKKKRNRKRQFGQPDCWKELTSERTHLTTFKMGRKKQSRGEFLPPASMPDVDHNLNYLFGFAGLWTRPEGAEEAGLRGVAERFLPLPPTEPQPQTEPTVQIFLPSLK